MKDLKKIIYENLYHQVDEKLYHQQVDEKMVITKDTKEKQISDEELENDYQTVRNAFTKSEKKGIADKYGCTDYRIKPIMDIILDKFRENRQYKKEFTPDDIKHFFRYDPPETYDKFKKFLEQEPDVFIVYFYEYYEEKINNNKMIKKYRYSPNLLSYADRRTLKIFDNLKKYIKEKGIQY